MDTAELLGNEYFLCNLLVSLDKKGMLKFCELQKEFGLSAMIASVLRVLERKKTILSLKAYYR